MKEEKNTIDLIMKALMKYIEAAIQKMEMDQKWHEEIMGIVTPDLKENSQYGTNQVGDFIAHNIVDIEDDTLMNDENIDLGKSTII